jgi:hypothetical protein
MAEENSRVRKALRGTVGQNCALALRERQEKNRTFEISRSVLPHVMPVPTFYGIQQAGDLTLRTLLRETVGPDDLLRTLLTSQGLS